ncbi:TCP family transcription factor [Actinidia rufa]|uniref:TCP family transcription factor n=1 Tax=Actinidia rufa TaxID=165716 RepID=A0A7J0GQM9_9ERIC|nr:TCP family transcription factor [Actinidia rufa]
MCPKSNYSNHQKTSKDRHIKVVDGRDRRVRIPVKCAALIFELSKRLGHRTAGQTIEWLLHEAEPAVTLAFSNPGSPCWLLYQCLCLLAIHLLHHQLSPLAVS